MTGLNTIHNIAASPEADLERLRDVVGEVVGSVFYGTLLKTMRQSELNGPYGHGGRGEEVFAAQLHGIMAEDMGKAAKREGLAAALYNAMEHQQRLISRSRVDNTQALL
ncbi:MAG: hypothetical protein ACE5HE_12975 [Phycisphaerae bacterium]